MQSIAEALAASFEQPQQTGRKGSELDAILLEIEKVIPITKQYGYNFWRGMVGKRQVGYTEMVGILKEIGNMDIKYNKGATLVNKIKKIPYKKKPAPVPKIRKVVQVENTQSLFG